MTRRSAVLASAAAVVAVGTCLLVARRRRRGPPSSPSDDDIVFVDHREATFSLWRRDVEDRLDTVERMLQLLESDLLPSVDDNSWGATEGTSTMNDVVGGTDGATASSLAPTAHEEDDARTRQQRLQQQQGAESKSLLEVDEQLTKLMIKIDGAPVSNLDHLRVERRSLMQRALGLEARLAQARCLSCASIDTTADASN